MRICTAGVVGAGAMGAGIAYTISSAGLPVVLTDVSQALVEQGIDRVRAIYRQRAENSASQGAATRDLIRGATSCDALADVDIVIEAVPERMEVKKRVLREVEDAVAERCIIASNTSALSISEMAAATRRPARVLGMHFFYPAQVMKLVEVVPGASTSEEAVASAIAFAHSLRKIPVRVNECPGFLVNRLLQPYLNEAVIALQEGAATAAEIDRAMCGWGFRMGPLTLCDALGVEVCASVGDTLQQAYGLRMTLAALWGKLLAAGRLGAKSGAGFFRYGAPDAGDDVDQQLQAMIADTQADTGKSGTAFSVERLIYPMVNEAARCLHEQVAVAGDVDVATLAGIGFPPRSGGLLRYADAVGLDTVVGGLQRLEQELGPRFRPAQVLERMVADGQVGRRTGKGFHTY